MYLKVEQRDDTFWHTYIRGKSQKIEKTHLKLLQREFSKELNCLYHSFKNKKWALLRISGLKYFLAILTLLIQNLGINTMY